MAERTHSEHIVVVGPYGAGKTSLMLEVARQSDDEWYVARNYTNRARRPNEGDNELIFLSPAHFETLRPGFLTTHRTHTYEYGVPAPAYDLNHVSMRALPSNPDYVKLFRSRVEERGLGRVTICQIVVPDVELLEARLRARDPNIAPDDLAARLRSNQTQPDIVGMLGGLTFRNDHPTIAEAGAALLAQFNEHFSA